MKRYQVAVITEPMNVHSQGILEGITTYIFENGPWNVMYEEHGPGDLLPIWLETWHGDGIITYAITHNLALMAQKTGAYLVDLGEDHLLGVPTVYSDYERSSQLAASHFLQRNYDHFAYLGLLGHPFSQRYKDAFSRVHEGKVFTCDVPPNIKRMFPISSENMLTHWLRSLPKPCGILACDDLIGVYVIQACNWLGMKVPEEVGVIGVGNDPVQCQMSPIPMTSVDSDLQKLGYEAASMLHQLMKGDLLKDKSLRVSPRGLVVRQSTDIHAVSEPVVRKAVEIIRTYLSHGLSALDVAEKLGVSRRLLEHHFNRILGRTVLSQIRLEQMAYARHLIKSTRLSDHEIARQVGMKDAAQLMSAFRRVYHHSLESLRK